MFKKIAVVTALTMTLSACVTQQQIAAECGPEPQPPAGVSFGDPQHSVFRTEHALWNDCVNELHAPSTLVAMLVILAGVVTAGVVIANQDDDDNFRSAPRPAAD